jgi:hypothetical protein
VNVTVSLPAELAKAARHLAVDRGVSLSRYLAELIEEKVGTEGERRAARERQRQMMAEGLKLGMPHKVTWTRDDLHER